jgi:transcriptional regulator with XRE-family HTH domain
METTDQKFSIELRNQQVRLGLTQAELAKTLGLSPRLIWSWLNGVKEPTEIQRAGIRAKLNQI